jgi:hypothetical protein
MVCWGRRRIGLEWVAKAGGLPRRGKGDARIRRGYEDVKMGGGVGGLWGRSVLREAHQ